MLKLTNINKHFGNLHVLHDINMEVGDGEIVAIYGPSGAGKTTLLQIAGSLDRADSGEVWYDGDDISRLSDKKLAEFRCLNIGFVFQFHELLPEFSALENVAMPALIAGKSKKEAYRMAEEILTELGMSHRLKHKPSQLSGGEKQRVAVARAIVNSPRLIFADEPTGSLDSRNRDEILEIITRLRNEHSQSFLIVTHDPQLARIADRIITMEDGRITGVSIPHQEKKESEAGQDDESRFEDSSKNS